MNSQPAIVSVSDVLPKNPTRPKRRLRRVMVHGLRAILFGLIVLLIHFQHKKLSSQIRTRSASELSLARVQDAFPKAAALGKFSAERGQEILDENGKSLGYVLQTSPAADHIIGFSGPTNVMLLFDPEHRLIEAKILHSEDTQEHVDEVRESPAFWASLRGRTWDELADAKLPVDAVSGATLTSLAIRESILHRLGGEKPASLRFPDLLKPRDVVALFPEAASIGERDGTYGLLPVFAKTGEQLGWILNTSPAADGVIGYQGPTQTLIGFDHANRCIGLVVRDTFDNAEYVEYIREDEYFPSLFEGMTPTQLADLDLKEAGVEGVSGATMTSLAVANGLKLAAAESLRPKEMKPAVKETGLELSVRDWGTTLVLVLGLLIGFTGLRGRKWVRVSFQAVLIVYLGFINGDLLSQALLVGWAKHGVAWKSATGLVLLSGAAVILPILSKQNVYCHHLCPHGAMQQLLKNRLPWQVRLPKPVVWILSAIPAALLALVVAVPMLAWPLSLVNLEPFDAYVFQVAGAATLAIFFGGLIASLFVPMAYCRFGCPTGALLGFLRFHGHSDRLGRKDAVAAALLAMALLIFATTP